jgi:hypothetical protein
MARMEADPGALAAAARALREATAVAREVHKDARSLSDAAVATGSAEVAMALLSFRHTWSYGLGLVVDDADTLARMLGQAARAYEDVETAIGKACRP